MGRGDNIHVSIGNFEYNAHAIPVRQWKKQQGVSINRCSLTKKVQSITHYFDIVPVSLSDLLVH